MSPQISIFWKLSSRLIGLCNFYFAKFLIIWEINFSNGRVYSRSNTLNLSMLFMVSNFFSAKMSSKWRLNPGFGTQNVLFPNRCPFNRGQNCGHVPQINVSQRRGYTVIERCNSMGIWLKKNQTSNFHPPHPLDLILYPERQLFPSPWQATKNSSFKTPTKVVKPQCLINVYGFLVFKWN